MESYSTDPAWEDVVPMPQDEGGPNPLAAIAYTEEYSEAMAYFRAVMADNEFSERVLALTEHIIGLNPAHYTIWCVALYVSHMIIIKGMTGLSGYIVPRHCSSSVMT